MPTPHDLVLMARYNQWMNQKIYAATQSLPIEEVTKDRGAYFQSILGTLNHLYVADIVWLKRFSRHPSQFTTLASLDDQPSPTRLDEIVHERLPELWAARVKLDTTILKLAAQITQFDLNQVLSYKNRSGEPKTKSFSDLLQHFFNHQTHHRGQLTTLLGQAGKTVEPTDLLVLLDDA